MADDGWGSPLTPGMKPGDIFTIEGGYGRRKGWWPALLAALGFHRASRSTELQRYKVLDEVTSEPGQCVRYEEAK